MVNNLLDAHPRSRRTRDTGEQDLDDEDGLDDLCKRRQQLVLMYFCRINRACPLFFQFSFHKTCNLGHMEKSHTLAMVCVEQKQFSST